MIEKIIIGIKNDNRIIKIYCYHYNIMITRQGYKIDKSKVDQRILDELIVHKSVLATFNDLAKPYNILRESDKYYYMPRFFGISKCGNAIIKIPYNKIQVTFTGELRPQQQQIINSILPKLLNQKGGIITLPCGYGKTVIALYILCYLKVKTLIIVGKEFLLNQWKERINEFINEYQTNNKHIGIIQQNNIDTDHDIVIATIQSLALRDYPSDKLKNFGLIISDECHHIAAQKFCSAFDKVNAKYIIGLTATPKRKDGLSKVINWYIGDFLYKLSNTNSSNAEVYKINYTSTDPLFKEELMYRKGKHFTNITKLITNITKIQSRNKIIIDILIYYAKLDKNILLLSERIEHLKMLYEIFNNKTDNIYNTGLYIGSTPKSEKQRIEQESKIIFGSYALAQEGLDIKRLDTLILSTPQKDIIQSIGRVMRQQLCKSLIIDIVDDLPIFLRYYIARNKIYKERNYKINDININNDYEIDL